jgi:predicted permease
MSALDGLVHRFRVLLHGEAYAREQQREVAFHLELETLERSHKGATILDAELAARQSFGNVAYYREEMRAMTSLAAVDRLQQNVAYAARGLLKAPGFAVAVITAIALGVGLNAAIFSLLDRVLLRPPAGVAVPGELRRLYIDPGYAVTSRGSHVFGHFSYANYRAVRDATPSGAVIVYSGPDSVGLGDAGAIVAHVSFVSPNYFSLLGVKALAGRTFDSTESAIETPTPVMLISERLWRGGFGADPKVLGRTVRMGQLQLTIVGILPAAFTGLELGAADTWVPLNMFDGGSLTGGRDWIQNGGGNFFTAVARVSPGANETEWRTREGYAVAAISEQLRGRPDSSKVLMGPIVEARGPAETPLELTLATRVAGVALIVLVIACANVATLLLVRATRRQREIAVRRALGASQARLFEQVLTESSLLALLGGVAALAFAAWGGVFLRRFLFPSVNWVGGVVDWRLLGLTGLVVVVVATTTGLAPATASMRAAVMNALRVGSTDAAHRGSRLSAALLASQAALCVVLLVGAGLFVRSFSNVCDIDLGFASSELIIASLPSSTEQRFGPEFAAPLADAAAALKLVPGVRSTALASVAPMAGMAFTRIYRPNGDSLFRIGDESPSYSSVTPDYFATANVRLVSGRLFDASDRESATPVMIVSRKMARLVWPGESPIGQCLVLGQPGAACTTVVGLVEDTHRVRILEAPGIQFYLPLAQSPGFRAPTIIVRAEPSRRSLVIEQARSQILRVIPGVKRLAPRTMESLLERELRPWRLGAVLFSLFGVLALAVAAIGIYSVVAYAVSQRTHEMGVRIALGASVRDILDLVVMDRMAVVGIGITVGLGIALVLGRYVRSLLFGVTANDPSILVGGACVLTGVAIAASIIPAWRAARTDPSTALRAD